MSAHHDVAKRVNRVFLDFENVAEIDPKVLKRKDIFLTVFYGPKQKKIDIEAAKAIHEHSKRVKMVKVKATGKNALDFVLAGYVGYAVRANPADHFHIISKDKGFDALVKQLRGEKICAHRHDGFEEILTPGKEPTEGAVSNQLALPEDPVNAAMEILRKRSFARPAKRKTLATFLRSSIGSDLSKQEAQDVIDALCSSGKIKIEEKNLVTYLF